MNWRPMVWLGTDAGYVATIRECSPGAFAVVVHGPANPETGRATYATGMAATVREAMERAEATVAAMRTETATSGPGEFAVVSVTERLPESAWGPGDAIYDGVDG